MKTDCFELPALDKALKNIMVYRVAASLPSNEVGQVSMHLEWITLAADAFEEAKAAIAEHSAAHIARQGAEPVARVFSAAVGVVGFVQGAKVNDGDLLYAAPQEAQAGWKHDCAALCTNGLELWIGNCPHCGMPRECAAPVAQPATEAGQGEREALSERKFSEWLNANRNRDVSSIFHDTVAHYAAALANMPAEPMTLADAAKSFPNGPFASPHIATQPTTTGDEQSDKERADYWQGRAIAAERASKPNGVMAAQDAETWTDEDVDNLCWSAFESGMAGGMSVDSFRWLANSLRLKRLPARAARTRGADGSGL